jgi:hypothetical protein
MRPALSAAIRRCTLDDAIVLGAVVPLFAWIAWLGQQSRTALIDRRSGR